MKVYYFYTIFMVVLLKFVLFFKETQKSSINFELFLTKLLLNRKYDFTQLRSVVVILRTKFITRSIRNHMQDI